MLTPRSVFVLLVLAQLVTFGLVEIVGTLKAAIITPLWQLLFGPRSLLITDGVNIGAIIGSLLASILCLILGIMIFAAMVRRWWPWLARTFQLESTDR
ncbi:MAG TPA: hypothetical protein VGE67_05980 [Haloferula sp.]